MITFLTWVGFVVVSAAMFALAGFLVWQGIEYWIMVNGLRKAILGWWFEEIKRNRGTITTKKPAQEEAA